MNIGTKVEKIGGDYTFVGLRMIAEFCMYTVKRTCEFCRE